MSQYFQTGDRILWNPATTVAQVFLHAAESFARLADRPSGLGPMIADECEIDMPTFAEFTDSLISQYGRSDHVILRALTEGFIATAMAMVERAGGQLPAAQSRSKNPALTALQDLSRRIEKAMPAG